MSLSQTFSGMLVLDKPAGVTSRDVVNRIQRAVRPLRTGHAGTLDPPATGVLLVCVGDATRLVRILQLLPKTYMAPPHLKSCQHLTISPPACSSSSARLHRLRRHGRLCMSGASEPMIWLAKVASSRSQHAMSTFTASQSTTGCGHTCIWKSPAVQELTSARSPVTSDNSWAAEHL